MPYTNKHGLARYIPNEVEREVRQRSKFCCVICASPFCTYEHFDPEFSEALEHSADGICLLCGKCHDRTTRGQLAKEVIKNSYLSRQKAENCKSEENNFQFFTQLPKVLIGESSIEQCETILCTSKERCLGFTFDQASQTFLIDMKIRDALGNILFEVVENTWRSEYQPWDIEVSGKTITFRTAPGKIAFKALLDPTNSVVTISHLDMNFGNCRFTLSDGYLRQTRFSSSGDRYIWRGYKGIIQGGDAAFFIDDREELPKHLTDFELLGHNSCGLSLGVNSATTIVNKLILGHDGFEPPISRPEPLSDHTPEAVVEGTLAIRVVRFPFWTEQEYYLNGIKLSERPWSAHDLGTDELGGFVELFHLIQPDAQKFDKSSGWIADTLDNLTFPVDRPRRMA